MLSNIHKTSSSNNTPTPGKITSLLVAELEEGWSEVAWRPSTPLSPLTMHTSSNDSMTLVVKGYISSRDEEVDEKVRIGVNAI